MNGESSKDWLKKIVDLMEHHLGEGSEIVLQNYREEFDRTIVDIRNGHITGRRIGDGGHRSLGVELETGTVHKGDRYNYRTHTRNAKTLRSSSAYFRDDTGKVVYSISINTDITQTMQFEHFLRCYNGFNTGADDTRPIEDVAHTLERYLEEARLLVEKPVDAMNKADKMVCIKYLDDVGAFLITKSGERICEYLKISKFSLYHYLDTVRGSSPKEEK